jgi:hypothetical protein
LVYVKYTLDKYLKKFFLSDQFVGIWWSKYLITFDISTLQKRLILF